MDDLDSYYLYSRAILRVDHATKKLYRRKRQNGLWEEIFDPIIWERIQRDGEKISQEEAERLFSIFRY